MSSVPLSHKYLCNPLPLGVLWLPIGWSNIENIIIQALVTPVVNVEVVCVEGSNMYV